MSESMKNKRGQIWTMRQAAGRNGVLQLYIYGTVERDTLDWQTGKYVESETSAEYFRQELARYADISEIEIFINSDGGSVTQGTAIYTQLRRHPAHKTVYIDGFACSVAAVIAMAGDVVVMPRNTLMMIHNAWNVVAGNAQELRKAADDLDIINRAGRQAFLQKAGDKLTEKKLVEMMDAETWLTAEDCIALGLADRFAEQDADMTKAGEIMQKINLSIEQHIQRHKHMAAQLRQLREFEEPPRGQMPSADVDKPSLMELLGRIK